MKITLEGSSDDLCIIRDAIQDKYHELKPQTPDFPISIRRERLFKICKGAAHQMSQAITHNRDITINIF